MDIIEKTAIPVTGDEASIGAKAFIAVLAYPSRKDWQKRTDFINALRAAEAKRYLSSLRPGPNIKRDAVPSELRNEKNQHINNSINKVVRVIVNKRIPAARIASEKILHDCGAFSWLGNVFAMNGAHLTVGKHNITELARKETRWLRSANPDTMAATSSVLRDVWVDSLPVIHLAVAFRAECETRFRIQNAKFTRTARGLIVDSKNFDLLDLINNPSWVSRAVRNAEMLRGIFHRDPLVNQREAVVLVCKEYC